MPAQLLLKRSSVAGKVPTTAQLQAGELALNTADSKIYASNGTTVFQVNSGTYGLSRNMPTWQNVSGLAPIESYEFDDRSLLFEQGQGQAIVCFVKVPTAYVAGSQIILRIGHYSPSSANNFKFNTLTTLIRKNTDAISSTTNQLTSTNADQPLTVANQYLEILYNLTDATGKINAIAVGAGDLLKVQLSRVATTGTDDINNVRVLVDTAEVIFS
jgi:hypothetical protein